MIPVFIEAALRSLLVGLAVAVGLRIFRVRNVLAQKAAWGLVLVSALAMPLLLPVTAQWNLLPATVNIVLPAHPMTLLEELQARIQSKGGSETKFTPPIVPIPHKDSTRTHFRLIKNNSYETFKKLSGSMASKTTIGLSCSIAKPMAALSITFMELSSMAIPILAGSGSP